jgi:hypothetical protein
MYRRALASRGCWISLACALPCVPAARADSAPLDWLGPARAGKSDGARRAGLNARCEACHAAEARAWRGSLHQRAFSDRLFQSAYTLEPLAFCRGCHAPEADPARSPPLELAALGVACTTCHVDSEGQITASRVSGNAPHAVRSEPALATRKACARCHEFEFPTLPGAFMQSTLSEHANSSAHGRECQACHMPLSGERGAPRHDFTVLGDPELVRSAVKISASRWNERSIEVTLRPGAVGHAFPTGDLFRRLELRACVEQADREICAPPGHLGRRYRVQVTPEGTRRVPIADTRLPAPGTAPSSSVRLAFELDVSKLPVRWSVVYQRADDAMARVLGLDLRADEMLLASGQLPEPRLVK